MKAIKFLIYFVGAVWIVCNIGFFGLFLIPLGTCIGNALLKLSGDDADDAEYEARCRAQDARRAKEKADRALDYAYKMQHPRRNFRPSINPIFAPEKYEEIRINNRWD
jgi:hypothetical protein